MSLGVGGIPGVTVCGYQAMPLCFGWGTRPTWNGSQIKVKHIQGVWEHSYVENSHMDPPSCHIHHTLWQRVLGVGEILVSQHVATNQCHDPLIKAPWPHTRMVPPTSSPNIYKVFENIHMLWTVRLIHNHATSTILFGQELQELGDFLSQCGYKWCHCAMVEAPDPPGMVSISRLNIRNVFENIHMLLICRWVHHQSTSTILIGLDEFGSWRNSRCHSVWLPSNAIVLWLRHQTHMEWFPNQG